MTREQHFAQQVGKVRHLVAEQVAQLDHALRVAHELLGLAEDLRVRVGGAKELIDAAAEKRGVMWMSVCPLDTAAPLNGDASTKAVVGEDACDRRAAGDSCGLMASVWRVL